MRTSAIEINRAYIKHCRNSNTLAIVKPEPTEELLNRAKSGRIDHPIILKQEVLNDCNNVADGLIQGQSNIPISSYQQPITQYTIECKKADA